MECWGWRREGLIGVLGLIVRLMEPRLWGKIVGQRIREGMKSTGMKRGRERRRRYVDKMVRN